MMGSSVIEKRATTGDLIKHGACPVREFSVYIVGLDLMLIDKISIIVDITQQNYKKVAKKKVKDIMLDREDYVVKVKGQHTTVLLEEHRLFNKYKESLCKMLNYDSEDYMKEFENDLVRFLITSDETPSIKSNNSIDYSEFGVI